MFGLLKGPGCHLNQDEKKEWLGHVCGLCLTLRAQHGQLSRFTTNYDAALLSVLCAAQSPTPLIKSRNICALRAFQPASVIDAANPGAQYAASIALLMAATKIDDHITDGDGWWPILSRWTNRLTSKWQQVAHQGAHALGFPAENITANTRRQQELEQQNQSDFFFYSQPTELSVGAAFGHTAVIAACLQNRDSLVMIGWMFGRIMFLLDSYQDYVTDVASRKFNALARCFAPDQIQKEAREIFRQAHTELHCQFERLILPHPDLARKLLVEQLRQTGYKTLRKSLLPDPGLVGHGKNRLWRTLQMQIQEHVNRAEQSRNNRRHWCDCAECCHCCDPCSCCDCCNCCNSEGGDCCSCDCCGCDC